jgi:hypothetical protein
MSRPRTFADLKREAAATITSGEMPPFEESLKAAAEAKWARRENTILNDSGKRRGFNAAEPALLRVLSRHPRCGPPSSMSPAAT